jgi:Rrf2 family protein
LTRDSRYAIDALVVLARHPDARAMRGRDIAEAAHLPAAYLSKILRQLTIGGVVRSRRGDGYVLERDPAHITLGEILRAVEGEDLIWDTCIFWREECDADDPCPLHFRWRELKPEIQGAMDALTLADIVERGLPVEPRRRRPAVT